MAMGAAAADGPYVGVAAGDDASGGDGLPRERPRTASALRCARLKPGLTRLRRGPESVQFGLDPDRAILVTGVDAALSRCLDRLDGTAHPADVARALAVPVERLARLLDLLAAADLLADDADAAPGWAELPVDARDRLAPDLASLLLAHPGPAGGKDVIGRRLRTSVEIRGGGRIGAPLATLLAAAGVGGVRVVDPDPATPADLAPGGLSPADLDRPRGSAATARAARHGPHGPGRRPQPGPQRPAQRRAGSPAPAWPDLVVFADRAPDVAEAERLVEAGVPHLVATLRDTEGVIGPLVVPGHSACLRCQLLARTDRDRAWPDLAAQLRLPQQRYGVRACDVVLAATVAGHAALQVLTYLETGTASTVDGTLHLRLTGGTLRRRTWRRHPGCDCVWAAPPGARSAETVR